MFGCTSHFFQNDDLKKKIIHVFVLSNALCASVASESRTMLHVCWHAGDDIDDEDGVSA